LALHFALQIFDSLFGYSYHFFSFCFNLAPGAEFLESIGLQRGMSRDPQRINPRLAIAHRMFIGFLLSANAVAYPIGMLSTNGRK
jgi:hypothetical protein